MKTRVYMIESEAGWGQKIDEVKEFDTREEAIEFAKQYNLKYNNKTETPSWYIVAKLEGEY